MNAIKNSLLTLLTLITICTLPAFGQGTAFTYQGRLENGGSAANGLYEMSFGLYDAVTNGNLVGTPVTVAPVAVSNGLFTVLLDYGVTAFNGSPRWLEITLDVYGSDMVPTTVHPRQLLTATPYALHAHNAANLMNFADAPLDIKVNGQRALRLEQTQRGPNVIGGISNNVVAPGVAGATIGGGGGGDIRDDPDPDEEPFSWGFNSVTADFGTVSGGWGNSVGGIFGTVAGGRNNAIQNNAGGATIAGGLENTVEGDTPSATIAGGQRNSIGSRSSLATIGGGLLNEIGRQATFSTIAGGYVNRIGSNLFSAAIVGGTGNNIGNESGAAMIGGGANNMIESLSPASVIGGGSDNTIATNSASSVIGGGHGNRIAEWSPFSVIAAGHSNTIAGDNSAIGGGSGNYIDSDSSFSVIAGGQKNDIISSADHSAIGGGYENELLSEASVIAGGELNRIDVYSDYNVISGGQENTIATSSPSCVIAGGRENSIGTNSTLSVISGGWQNNITANAGYATVSGGLMNTIWDNAFSSTIAGGYENDIRVRSSFSAIGGGGNNNIGSDSPHSVIPGGSENSVSNGVSYAFAAGRRAHANHTGSFVWADSQFPVFSSTTNNEFSVRATGGTRFVSGFDENANPTVGVTLAPGSGSWTATSDRNAKENFEPVNARAVLDKVAALPVSTWNYKSQKSGVRHIGPMAQDFKAAFGLGETDTGITTVDADGVALAAIQGLNQKLEAELKAKDAHIKTLEHRLQRLENLLHSLGTAAR